MTNARSLVASQGRTVTWCAAQLDVERAEFSRMLNGRKPMSDDIARRLAALLGVPVAWIQPTEPEAVPA